MRSALPLSALPDLLDRRDVLPAGSDQVHLVREPARMEMPAYPDQGAARERPGSAERLVLVGQLQLGAHAVARFALARELLAERVVRGALLAGPRADAVGSAVVALDVEDRIGAPRAHVH